MENTKLLNDNSWPSFQNRSDIYLVQLYFGGSFLKFSLICITRWNPYSKTYSKLNLTVSFFFQKKVPILFFALLCPSSET